MMKIKHILAFCYEFPPIGGGAGNALYFLCREWVRQGVKVTVITSSASGYVSEQVDGIDVIRLNVRRRERARARKREMLRYIFHSVTMGLKFAEKNPVDMCLAFMAFPSGVAPFWIFKRRNIPYIVELRGGDVPGFDPIRLKHLHAITAGLIRKILRRASKVIANGSSLKQLGEQFMKNQIAIPVIPNGVDSNFFTVKDRNAKLGELNTIFVGRLADSQKNISFLIEQFRRNPEWNLKIVGDGPDAEILKDQSENCSNIKFFPWQEKAALKQMYLKSSCFVSASNYEGMPNSALEAMACGLPLLLSDIGGHRELVQYGNGALFNAEDPESFCKVLNELKDTDSLNEMSENSRKSAEQKYQWSEIAQNRRLLYEDALMGIQN